MPGHVCIVCMSWQKHDNVIALRDWDFDRDDLDAEEKVLWLDSGLGFRLEGWVRISIRVMSSAEATWMQRKRYKQDTRYHDTIAIRITKPATPPMTLRLALNRYSFDFSTLLKRFLFDISFSRDGQHFLGLDVNLTLVIWLPEQNSTLVGQVIEYSLKS